MQNSLRYLAISQINASYSNFIVGELEKGLTNTLRKIL